MTTPRRARRLPVAVVRTQPETFLEDLLRAWRLAQPAREIAAKGASLGTVVSVPSLLPLGPGARVSPWALAGALELVRRSSGRPAAMVLGAAEEPSPRLAGTGLDRVLERSGISLEMPRADLEVEASLVDLPWLRGRRGGSVRVDERLSRRDAVVVGPLRRSRSLGLRGAVDAALAAVATPRERSGEPVDPEAWAELLRLRRALHPSLTCVLDATVCGSAEGIDPPLLADFIVVSRDPVACDVVAAHLLGLDPTRWSWLRRVAEASSTPLELGAHEVRGESFDASALEAQRRSGVGAPAWPIPTSNPARGIGTLTRLTDPSRWMARWRRRGWTELYERTPWGRLHQDYRENGEAQHRAVEHGTRQETA